MGHESSTVSLHSHSALLTGGVILFGVLACANLLLPPQAILSPQASAPRAAAVKLAPSPRTLTAAPVTASAPVSSAPVSGDLAAVASSAPALSSQALSVASEPVRVLASVAVQQVEAEAPPPQRTVESVEITAHRAPTPSHKQVKPRAVAKAPSVAKTERASAVVAQFEEPSVSTVPMTPQLHISVSAILGTRAWVRIGNTKTVAVQAGDTVPSMGRVSAVTEDSVMFDSGRVVRVH